LLAEPVLFATITPVVTFQVRPDQVMAAGQQAIVVNRIEIATVLQPDRLQDALLGVDEFIAL
jgi:hypothetical protein